jgi:hypothetical protein
LHQTNLVLTEDDEEVGEEAGDGVEEVGEHGVGKCEKLIFYVE